MKKNIEVTGAVCYQLEVGSRAFITLKNGKSIMTSCVVDIRNKTSKGVEIETQKSIYKLTFFNQDEKYIA